MRKIIFILLVFTMITCNKEILPGVKLESYDFEKLDEDGGTWKPIVIENPESITIPAPLDYQSAAFRNEVEHVIENFNKDPEAIQFWGNNPILRWNEIAREIGAQYNLPPAPNADGVYVLPSRANPDVYPYFPFAHPPYMSRAFAYLSVAQFDALIVAWHYKYKYRQDALHKIDSRVKTVFTPNDLPSYPSDGAVVGAVSMAILSDFFPRESQYFKSRYEELKACLIASGTNTAYDIEAGEHIGKEIAKIFLARAAADGMNRAQSPRNISDSLAQVAFSKFGWKWENLEAPQRPVGITPLFGQVQTWFLPDVSLTRSVSPPAPGTAEFDEAANELKNIQAKLTKDQRRIANFWSDGPGTYTPPGHWNRIAVNSIVENKLNPLRSARVLAYMNAAIQDGGISCWDTKYYYFYPRPINAIKNFKTIIGTPNFPAYTSGHSTFSSAAATVLGEIFPEKKSIFRKHADEAGDSRVYGGIHFRFDCEAGSIQGVKVAQYALEAASKDGAD